MLLGRKACNEFECKHDENPYKTELILNLNPRLMLCVTMNLNQNQNPHRYKVAITLRTSFRVSRSRRASFRERGRRCERRLEAMGTARRPETVGSRASMMESTMDEVEGEDKSEY